MVGGKNRSENVPLARTAKKEFLTFVADKPLLAADGFSGASRGR